MYCEGEPCAGRAAPPPPTICGCRRRLLLIAAPPIPLLLRSYFLEFSMTPSLSSLPSCRFIPPMVICFSMLSFFFKFAVAYSSLIIQSSNFFLGFLLPHLQSILPSIISLGSESPVITCPIQFRCLVHNIVNRDLSSSTSFSTSFDMCSVQLIFSILRHTFISKASNLVMSSFLIVLISAQYKVTLQISVFTIRFLRHLYSSQSSPW